MESFEHNSIKYTLRERSYHREREGGYEKWTFEIEGKKYYFDGDIRYLPELNDKVLYVDFYSQAAIDAGDAFAVTNEEGYLATKIVNGLAQLVVNRLPYFRYYRYLVFPCPPKWHNAIIGLIKKYGTLIEDQAIIDSIASYLNYDLNVLIDSGSYFCYVGKL